ncbi:hypothetical protein L3Q82_001865 [Scortum barcoo]|uniref:Uncharacterized protein n=1 Tax=Scortum barcoo TaxID=214431 RepID=A0ACB8W5T2_9TELE|nr:hypothetical protein L3Q82_001865 [Scortum barcoo]
MLNEREKNEFELSVEGLYSHMQYTVCIEATQHKYMLRRVRTTSSEQQQCCVKRKRLRCCGCVAADLDQQLNEAEAVTVSLRAESLFVSQKPLSDGTCLSFEETICSPLKIRFQFLQDEGIDAMDWPTRSPDLNPIEHIWDIMSRSIHQRHVAPQTVQELADALVQVWEEIPQETILPPHQEHAQALLRKELELHKEGELELLREVLSSEILFLKSKLDSSQGSEQH